jgi:hypothetical protein
MSSVAFLHSALIVPATISFGWTGIGQVYRALRNSSPIQQNGRVLSFSGWEQSCSHFRRLPRRERGVSLT